MGSHRAQLAVGHGGCIVVTEAEALPLAGETLVRVPNVDAHHRRAVSFGVRIVAPPADYPYGERQYSALDCDGHRWIFSQSIEDADPGSWGAVVGDLSS